MRIEKDTMGEIAVDDAAVWGAQTQRSLENFPIGKETMPDEIIRSFAILKKACATVNLRLGILDPERADLISAVCDEILCGKLDGQFPLKVWQTGSGTQTNMNLNEVIANRANTLAGKKLLHPNDHVNLSQSSNDTFPTALHVSCYLALREKLLPALEELIAAFAKLEADNAGIVKIGRTHLQDAVPISFSQEISGWRAMLERSRDAVKSSSEGLLNLAIGGTAVGTGLNAPRGFAEGVATEIASLTSAPFVSAPNKFQALASKDDLSFAHGALRTLAADLLKIANDVRWLASGPRCGLGEINIPANEPGSSIMPGKVNPTQCEALTMVAAQVFGNDTTIAFAASQGNFELNVYLPVCAYNFLQSANLLADAMDSFRSRCVVGITPNREKMNDYLQNSLMLVTALTPKIGYDNAAKIAKYAHTHNTSLAEAASALGLPFDVKPEEMV